MVKIALDPAQMAASLSEIVANLPAMLNALQAVTFLLLVLFFGSITIVGFRIYMPLWKNLLVRVVFGFLSLFSGSAIAGFMPVPDNLIVKLAQIDMVVGGVVAAVFFAVSLFVLSKAISSEDTIKRAIEKLQKALKKEHDRPKPKNTLSNPYFLAGAVMIALFLILSAANFTGFPSLQEEVMGAFGMTQDDFESLSGMLQNVKDMDIPQGIGDMPNECYGLLNALGNNPDSMSSLSEYNNPQLEAKIEQETGEDVLDMKRTTVDGQTAIVAVTTGGNTCIASENELCVCN